MKAQVGVLVAAALFPGPGSAQSLDWATHDQLSVASQLGSAYANAMACNQDIDIERTAAIIREKIAPQLTPQMTASLMFMVVGVQALQAQVLGTGQMKKKELAAHCASMLSAFGPNGTQLKGVVFKP